ncbi:MAG: cohesin domain-containing protein, partial [Planctomycetes bacterium]|nr:cohesin domain-containing protein [Planctomycetota bacterium]
GGEDDDDPLKGQPAGMTLQADRRTVKTGGSVTVPIRMLNGKNVGNLDFKVTYDPAVVRPQGKAIRGNLLDNASMQSNPADSGRVWIAFATAGRISGDGTIAQLPFEAVGQPGQKTVLGLEVTIFNESTDSSQITKIPGEIEILTASGRLRGDMNGNGIIDAADAMEALKMAVRLIPMDLDADMDDDKTVTSADARILLRKAKER